MRDFSDSSLIVRLTAGRAWIAVLCALLGGIVALNVVSLSLNAGSGRVEQQINDYDRANSGLRGELAELLSASRVEEAAANLGLAVPAAQDVGYVTASDDNFSKFLDKIDEGTLLGGELPISSSDEPAVIPEYTGEAEAPSAPDVSAPAVTAPASPAPTQAAPPAASPAPAPSGGVGAGL